jgi:predicted nucleotidyltransferase
VSADGFDPKRILVTLADHHVDFVVIGAVAGVLHGSAYATYDVDVAYRADPENSARLQAAAAALDDSLDAFAGTSIPYERLRAEATTVEIEGRTIAFASLDHLIAMKDGRPETKHKLTATEYRVLSDELRAPKDRSGDEPR